MSAVNADSQEQHPEVAIQDSREQQEPSGSKTHSSRKLYIFLMSFLGTVLIASSLVLFIYGGFKLQFTSCSLPKSCTHIEALMSVQNYNLLAEASHNDSSLHHRENFFSAEFCPLTPELAKLLSCDQQHDSSFFESSSASDPNGFYANISKFCQVSPSDQHLARTNNPQENSERYRQVQRHFILLSTLGIVLGIGIVGMQKKRTSQHHSRQANSNNNTEGEQRREENATSSENDFSTTTTAFSRCARFFLYFLFYVVAVVVFALSVLVVLGSLEKQRVGSSAVTATASRKEDVKKEGFFFEVQEAKKCVEWKEREGGGNASITAAAAVRENHNQEDCLKYHYASIEPIVVNRKNDGGGEQIHSCPLLTSSSSGTKEEEEENKKLLRIEFLTLFLRFPLLWCPLITLLVISGMISVFPFAYVVYIIFFRKSQKERRNGGNIVGLHWVRSNSNTRVVNFSAGGPEAENTGGEGGQQTGSISNGWTTQPHQQVLVNTSVLRGSTRILSPTRRSRGRRVVLAVKSNEAEDALKIFAENQNENTTTSLQNECEGGEEREEEEEVCGMISEEDNDAEQNLTEAAEQNLTEAAEQNLTEAAEQNLTEAAEQNLTEAAEQNLTEAAEQNLTEAAEQNLTEAAEQNHTVSQAAVVINMEDTLRTETSDVIQEEVEQEEETPSKKSEEEEAKREIEEVKLASSPQAASFLFEVMPTFLSKSSTTRNALPSEVAKNSPPVLPISTTTTTCSIHLHGRTIAAQEETQHPSDVVSMGEEGGEMEADDPLSCGVTSLHYVHQHHYHQEKESSSANHGVGTSTTGSSSLSSTVISTPRIGHFPNEGNVGGNSFKMLLDEAAVSLSSASQFPMKPTMSTSPATVHHKLMLSTSSAPFGLSNETPTTIGEQHGASFSLSSFGVTPKVQFLCSPSSFDVGSLSTEPFADSCSERKVLGHSEKEVFEI